MGYSKSSGSKSCVKTILGTKKSRAEQAQGNHCCYSKSPEAGSLDEMSFHLSKAFSIFDISYMAYPIRPVKVQKMKEMPRQEASL